MLPLSFVGAPLEMTKRRWKDLMHALYENHFDPRKDEELKQSKIEIENKLPKIVKLVKNQRQNRRNKNAEVNARKEAELIELIEDFHKQYQFVYGLYDNLRGQLSQTVNNNKEDEGYFTATSSSDSESESEKEVNTPHTPLQIGQHKVHFEKQELADLQEKSVILTEEKESLQSRYMEAMKKSDEDEKTAQKFEEESRALKEELRGKKQEFSRFAQMHKDCQKEISVLIKELESEICSCNVKLNAMCTEKRSVEAQAENKELQAQVSKLEKVAKEMDEELSVQVNEESFVIEVSKIKSLVVQMNNLKFNVGCLSAQKSDSNGSASHENLLDQVNKMKRDLGALRKSNSELEWKIKKKARENSDFLTQIDNLKKELAGKTQRMQKEKDDSLLRVKNLESEVLNLTSQKSELERQLVIKGQENVEMNQEMEGLQEKTSKMKTILKEHDDQFGVLQKNLESEEDDNKPAKMVSLMSEINNLEHELGSKNSFERQLKIKNQEIMKMTSEKDLLQIRVSELENKLADRGNEFSALQNDMSTQIVALTKQVNQLQQETDMKRKLKDQISSQERENNQLEEEKESLQAKILELEIALTEKEDEIASFQRRLQVGENETSGRVSGLSSQISYLEGALSSERKKSLEKLSHVENKNTELTSQITNQQAILKQQEDTINKLREDCKLVKGRFLQAADRKMDEVADEFRKNFEDKLRILSQRIRVAEQLHAEDKDNLKKMRMKCEQEHPGIDRKLADLMSSSKADFLKLSKAVDEMMKGMEHVIKDFDSKEGSFKQRLSRVSDELQVAKNWVRWTMDELKPWKNEPTGSPFAPLDEKEQEKVLKEKVKRLEAKVNKEKGDKLRLMRGMYDLQKKVAELDKKVTEKDEGLSRLGEEKIEAIKQLCVWIEYHRSRFDQLKEIMLVNNKTKVKGRS